MRLRHAFQVPQAGGNVLHQPVVDFVGHELPVALVRLEQAAQKVLLLQQSLFGLLAFGNIGRNAAHAA